MQGRSAPLRPRSPVVLDGVPVWFCPYCLRKGTAPTAVERRDAGVAHFLAYHDTYRETPA